MVLADACSVESNGLSRFDSFELAASKEKAPNKGGQVDQFKRLEQNPIMLTRILLF